MSTERELFEEWAAKDAGFDFFGIRDSSHATPQRHHGEYFDGYLELAFSAWKAGRTAMDSRVEGVDVIKFMSHLAEHRAATRHEIIRALTLARPADSCKETPELIPGVNDALACLTIKV